MVRLEVIDFFDNTNSSLVHRVPEQGSADIKIGAQLIVQANQEAIFFRDGKAMDSFGAGRHTLTTMNVPILTKFLTTPWEKSPFQAQVYFIGKQTFLDQKWGSRQPIVFRDPEFGMVRLRSFGKYSFRVVDGPLLLNTLVGTQGKYTTDEVTSYLKDMIVSRMTDLMGKLGMGLLDIVGKYDEIGSATRAKVAEDFAKYGLELVDFFINAITPPDEVQKAIDQRTSMGAVGDLNAFMKFQAAQSMAKMAEKGGDAGGAMGMGMGAGFGMMFPGMLRDAMNAPTGAAQMPQQPVQPAAPARPMPAAPVMAAPTVVTAAAGGLDFGDLAPTSVGDPKTVVRAVVESSGYAIEESGDTWQVRVPIGSLRKQIVTIQFGQKDDAGHDIVSYTSTCGPFTEKNASALLKHNTKLVHAAFAVQKVGAADMVILQANQLADSLDPVAVGRVVAAVAWQADKVEEKLVGRDDN